MEMLWIACGLFAFGFLFTAGMARAGKHLPAHFNLGFNLAAFVLLTLFLGERGKELGRCPITTPFEMAVFMAWALVLIYLLVGPPYRLSLMGAFTSPLACVLLLIALCFLPHAPRVPASSPGFWIELHAALSVISYGAFALAGVAGCMYLVQQRQLKARHLHPLFFDLPAVRHLAVANRRLLILGFLLLSVGLGSGFMAGPLPATAKVGLALAVWILYGALLLHRWMKPEATTRFARLSIGAFAVSLVAFWTIAHFSH